MDGSTVTITNGGGSSPIWPVLITGVVQLLVVLLAAMIAYAVSLRQKKIDADLQQAKDLNAAYARFIAVVTWGVWQYRDYWSSSLFVSRTKVQTESELREQEKRLEDLTTKNMEQMHETERSILEAKASILLLENDGEMLASVDMLSVAMYSEFENPSAEENMVRKIEKLSDLLQQIGELGKIRRKMYKEAVGDLLKLELRKAFIETAKKFKVSVENHSALGT